MLFAHTLVPKDFKYNFEVLVLFEYFHGMLTPPFLNHILFLLLPYIYLTDIYIFFYLKFQH